MTQVEVDKIYESVSNLTSAEVLASSMLQAPTPSNGGGPIRGSHTPRSVVTEWSHTPGMSQVLGTSRATLGVPHNKGNTRKNNVEPPPVAKGIRPQFSEAFGALVVSRPDLALGLERRQNFSVCALNPQIIYDWLGHDPLGQLQKGLGAPIHSDIGIAYQSTVTTAFHGVYEVHLRNIPMKNAIEQKKAGPTVVHWGEMNSGNEFTIHQPTWM